MSDKIKFYHVEKGEKENYIYHEFEASYGKISDPLDDYYKEFDTVKEADKHGAERKAINAYEGEIREVDKHEEQNNSEYDAYQVREGLKHLSSILETGESKIIQNEKIGNVSLDKGHTGKDGYGLLHIIERRNEKNKLDEEKITALLYKVMDSAKSGYITDSINIREKNNDKRIGIEKDGIIAIVSRRKGTHEKFVLTGYEINKKKEEAAEAIRTVIACYGYTPEFSDFRKQVGAVVSSLQISHKANEKSIEIETARKAGYVQGVCECVAAIGEDHALGKNC